jgi:putative Mg2+ transporter-C (MgtC) family protein
MVGISLPSALPPRCRNVHDAQIRLKAGIFGQWNDSGEHLLHLLVAFLLALPIGWNRSREERGAGLRTFPLVSMAACGFVQTGLSVLGAGAATQGNIMQGVVTGIGFIGAGAIMRQGDATTGNATAASIWTVGIIGAAVGYGYFDIGLILAAANLAVLKFRAPAPATSAVPPDDSSGHHRD